MLSDEHLSAQPALPEADNNNDEEPPTCRICLCDGSPSPSTTDPTLRLISPCLCRGTISHVHIACLQQWRRSAHGRSESSTKCDQCGYVYEIRKTNLALFLLSDRGAFTLTALGLLLAVHVFGLVGYALCTDGTIVSLCNWLQLGQHRESSFLVQTRYGNILTIGGTTLAFLTFATYATYQLRGYHRAYQQGLIDPGRFYFTVAMMAMWIHNQIIERRSGRGMAVIGLFMACYHSYEGVAKRARTWSQWLGETILEPSQVPQPQQQNQEGRENGEDEADAVQRLRELGFPMSWEEGLWTTEVGEEPPEGDGNVASVQFRMPNGKRIVRRFDGYAAVQLLYAYAMQHLISNEPNDSEETNNARTLMLTAGFPPRDLFPEIGKSISSSRLDGEMITVRWTDGLIRNLARNDEGQR